MKALLLYGALALGFVTGLLTGLLENALVPLVLVALVYWHVRRRLPLAWLVVGIGLYFILDPVKFGYRSIVWYGSSQTTVADRVELWSDLATESVTSLLSRDAARQQDSTLSDSLARFDLVHKFAYVKRLTPTYIPYYQGQTYEYFVYALIPRVLWPEKPTVNANERIDIDYRLKVARSDANIGIGQLPEAYVNFGIAGIIVVMAIQLDTAVLDRILE